MGAMGALSAAPEAPLPRRAREIPPKAGVLRVTNNYRYIIVMNDLTDHCPIHLRINFNGPFCLNDEKLMNFDWRTIKSDNVNLAYFLIILKIR